MMKLLFFMSLFFCISTAKDETDDKHGDEAVGTGLLILAIIGIVACCWNYFKKIEENLDDSDDSYA